MIALIGSLQGEYSGSIDPSCTHLISAYDSSDKIECVFTPSWPLQPASAPSVPS